MIGGKEDARAVRTFEMVVEMSSSASARNVGKVGSLGTAGGSAREREGRGPDSSRSAGGGE